ncbi:nuclear transport factor 2 family protein [Streptomyces sp. H10-C2]|uniref:nuclear transport factor 2 family protein n=1 Tax=unclassified Streptomyces TaxID=2593676 RepID=UPI0024B8F2D4|nr:MULTISPECIES: nuclear transport factor 2 family protein [unclassified Streptomyces]MDJ0346496.1 nuclear transport factor 2 family protein [Streptomyces sp. PH10-H1]MDJ0374970.1 nuclear transport factor 2 family protein [Streptomyces sp. H10-C2]
MQTQTQTQTQRPAPNRAAARSGRRPLTPSGSAAPAEDAAVARVPQYYSLVDAGDVSGLFALFAPDARYHRPGYEPLVGHTDLLRFYRDERVIAEGAHTLTEVVVSGAQAAVHGEFHGVLHSGQRVGLRFADFFTLTPELTFAGRDTFFFTPLV